jgi:hypothetical protein
LVDLPCQAITLFRIIPIIVIPLSGRSAARRRTSSPKQGDPLLLPLQEWLERLRAYLHDYLEWAARNPDKATPLELLYLMEYSIDLLFQNEFRKRYAALLKKFPLAAQGRFMASDPEAGRAFVQQLGVISVIPSSSKRPKRDLIPEPRFPRPVVHHRARRRRNPAKTRPDNIRLLLDHIDFLGWHPQYLLACSRCGWLQGSLAPAESYASKIPHPCDQIREWWQRTGQHQESSCSAWDARRLIESFREEIWGFNVIKQPPGRRRGYNRCPISGDVASVLDTTMGLNPFPAGWPRNLRVRNTRHQQQRLEFLGIVLGRIRCQVCDMSGHIRYMPRFLLPIDADLSSASQASVLVDLSKRLDSARESVGRNTAARRILWIPKRMPPMKLVDLAQRFELRHEIHASASKREANWWLISMWLIGVAVATGRKPLRRSPSPSRGMRMTWWDLFEELGIQRVPKRSLDGEDVDREMHEVKRKIDGLVASKRDHSALVTPVRALFREQRFGLAASLLADFYTDEILPKKRAELRRKPI